MDRRDAASYEAVTSDEIRLLLHHSLSCRFKEAFSGNYVEIYIFAVRLRPEQLRQNALFSGGFSWRQGEGRYPPPLHVIC